MVQTSAATFALMAASSLSSVYAAPNYRPKFQTGDVSNAISSTKQAVDLVDALGGVAYVKQLLGIGQSPERRREIDFDLDMHSIEEAITGILRVRSPKSNPPSAKATSPQKKDNAPSANTPAAGKKGSAPEKKNSPPPEKKKGPAAEKKAGSASANKGPSPEKKGSGTQKKGPEPQKKDPKPQKKGPDSQQKATPNHPKHSKGGKQQRQPPKEQAPPKSSKAEKIKAAVGVGSLILNGVGLIQKQKMIAQAEMGGGGGMGGMDSMTGMGGGGMSGLVDGMDGQGPGGLYRRWGADDAMAARDPYADSVYDELD